MTAFIIVMAIIGFIGIGISTYLNIKEDDRRDDKQADLEERVERLEDKHQLNETDIIELRDRFGEGVEYIVRDMISGKGERWK